MPSSESVSGKPSKFASRMFFLQDFLMEPCGFLCSLHEKLLSIIGNSFKNVIVPLWLENLDKLTILALPELLSECNRYV